MDDPNLSVPSERISHLAWGLVGRKPAWRGASASVSSSMDALTTPAVVCPTTGASAAAGERAASWSTLVLAVVKARWARYAWSAMAIRASRSRPTSGTLTEVVAQAMTAATLSSGMSGQGDRNILDR